MNNAGGSLFGVAAVSLLLIHCAGDVSARPGRMLCSQHGARSEADISMQSALCEHQALVASLTPEHAVSVSYRVTASESTRYCLEDDDGEKHTAVLERQGVEVLRWQHGAPCVEAKLDEGVYLLRVIHASGAQGVLGRAADPNPDVLHTQWQPQVLGFSAQLRVTVNACPGCNLDGVTWPKLSIQQMPGAAGFSGNYEGASFKASVCTESTCVIGIANPDSPPHFGRTSFDGLQLMSNGALYVGFSLSPSSKIDLNSFGQMRLTNIRAPRSRLIVGWLKESDLSGSYFDVATFLGPDYQKISGSGFAVTPEGISRNQVSKARLDLASLAFFRSAGLPIFNVSYDIPKRTDLSGFVIDGREGHTIGWPKTPAGALDLARMNFYRAKVSNYTFSCANGGTLAGAVFAEAVLNAVNFGACVVRDATFDRAQITNVVAREADFSGSSFLGASVDGLDLSSSKLVGARLSNAAGQSMKKLSLVGADASLLTAENLAVEGFVANSSILTDAWLAGASLARASFREARVERTMFARATLDGATFSGVKAVDADFSDASMRNVLLVDGAFDSVLFTRADLTGATFTRSSACGGSLSGTKLGSADLSGSLIPSRANTYNFRDSPKLFCDGVVGQENALTEASTRCPDGAAGACADPDRWIPAGAITECCNPWKQGCVRYVSGSGCATNCNCRSLKCLAGVCG